MLLERIESEGLAHYSYLLGDGVEAVVIDPRRDADIYVEKAARTGLRLAYVLETHRNEDYAIGSLEVASRTGAEIWHADSQWDYRYGQPVKDDQTWKVGRLKLQAIHTGGHTPGSMSYLLYDPEGVAWMVFSGDTLFAGDIGRLDLLGMNRAKEMAELMYESIFQKILPLGDGVILCPGHGAGSVCGTAIAARTWTTIGLERRYNPRLKFRDKAEFINKNIVELERPPYFRQMEELNLEGAPLLRTLPTIAPLSAAEFAQKMVEATVVDIRSELSFSAAHIPGALSIWLKGLPSFAGWFLPYDRPLLLVNESEDLFTAVSYLTRLGYVNIAGYLSGGMLTWHTAGKESSSIKTVSVTPLCHHLDEQGEAWILDVRSLEELAKSGRIQSAHHIHITQLPQHLDEIPRDQPIYIFCGSGLRSMIAASLLQAHGLKELIVILGGLSGWRSATCPVIN